jgi:UDP-glucose 4-epimerase
MKMRRDGRHVMVTGGAGFIGSHLAARLLEEGHWVTVVDDLSTGYLSNVPEGADFIEADLGLTEAYAKLEALRCDAVFHLAGQSSGETSFADPLKDLRSHVLTSFLLLEWCRRTGCPRFLYSSSMSVYGDPDTLPVLETAPLRPRTYYGAAKVSAEAYVRLAQQLGTDTTIFRLFSVYGPGQDMRNKAQGMVSIFLSFMLEGGPVVVKGSLDRFRDFTYIDDVVDAWMAAVDEPATFGGTYNLCAGERTTVAELLAALETVVGDAAIPVEAAGDTPGDQFGVTGDNSLLAGDLGFTPRITLADGLARMVAAERARTRE